MAEFDIVDLTKPDKVYSGDLTILVALLNRLKQSVKDQEFYLASGSLTFNSMNDYRVATVEFDPDAEDWFVDFSIYGLDVGVEKVNLDAD